MVIFIKEYLLLLIVIIGSVSCKENSDISILHRRDVADDLQVPDESFLLDVGGNSEDGNLKYKDMIKIDSDCSEKDGCMITTNGPKVFKLVETFDPCKEGKYWTE
uniref:Lipoprotein n=1 Tax=Parastrongyloides trichosuri TaxID=131310 RepID=A0A0N4ZDL7_PARTI